MLTANQSVGMPSGLRNCDLNIAELIEQQATSRPQASAIIDFGRNRERVLTFRELNERAAGLAAMLYSHGMAPGDGALILHPMSAELYIFILALWRLGAIGIFLDPGAEREHLEHACTIFPPKAFFGSNRAHLLRFISPAVRRIPLHYSSSRIPGCHAVSSTLRRAKEPHLARTSAGCPALVTFTSGSTGIPRAAVRSHAFLLAQYRAVECGMALAPGRIDLTTMPVFVLANLVAGLTSVLPNINMRRPESCDWKSVRSQITKTHAGSAVASPSFIRRLAESCEHDSCCFPAIDKVFIGGAPVFPDVFYRARKIFPNAVITAAYGSTEAEPMTEITLDEITDDDFSRMKSGGGLLAGDAVPGIKLRVIREQWGRPIGRVTADEFASMVAAIGDAGEIVVSGDHVLTGYLRGEGDHETKFEVGETRWHRTGDLGYVDDRKRLWLLGRCSASIKDERGILYPFAVECAVGDDAGVAWAALVAFRGQRVLAVQLKDGKVLDSSKIQLGWARIDRVIAVKQMPLDRRHRSKIDYPKLSALLERLH
jgi:acyl-CoA synthetase (AMP-forming)/AMP-acid ligase II